MAVFRVEKNKGYTVMSNHHLRNKELSLKAKGLLSQMLSLPEDWDYTLAGLSLINREKIDAIREAVRELENAGYIQRSRERDEKGCLRGTTYVIYEQPPKLDLPTLEKPTLDNPTLEKPMLEKPTLENPTQLNKELLKTNLPTKEKLNTDISSTHSIPFHSLNPSPLEDAAQPPERKRKETTDAYSVYEEIIKDNIEYDYLIQDRYLDRDRIEEILALILETVCTKRRTIRIAGDDHPAELVKAKFMKLNSEHIRFVLDCMQENTTKILYTQLFNLLCDKADDEYGGRLPVHVRCLLDEFANIGQIPKFEKLIATIRSREISASIILQSQSQLKAIYKDNADTIAGNCDTTLFLGGKEKTTLKEMSEILGKETIDSFNTSENRGREVSHGLNYQKLGKQLMTEDEIAVMDGGKCILQLRGVRPFFSDKYDITKHPNYKYLSDYDKKNTFDMEKHLRRRPALVKPDEPFDYYEISEADLQEDTAHE